jgi:hypothetical protein
LVSSRTSARTWTPAAHSLGINMEPTLPVVPTARTVPVVGMQHLQRALLGSVSARSDRPEAWFDSNFVASMGILGADK